VECIVWIASGVRLGARGVARQGFLRELRCSWQTNSGMGSLRAGSGYAALADAPQSPEPAAPAPDAAAAAAPKTRRRRRRSSGTPPPERADSSGASSSRGTASTSTGEEVTVGPADARVSPADEADSAVGPAAPAPARAPPPPFAGFERLVSGRFGDFASPLERLELPASTLAAARAAAPLARSVSNANSPPCAPASARRAEPAATSPAPAPPAAALTARRPPRVAATPPSPLSPPAASPRAGGASPAAPRPAGGLAGWRAYVAAELHPAPTFAVADAVWGQTERDRVYNALLAVPFQLERLVWLGLALCADSFLAVFTLLPLRVAAALWALGAGLARRARGGKGAGNAPASPADRQPGLLRGDQIFDLLCAAMFAGVVAFVWSVRAGLLYFWVKEMTHEFLKLSVLQSALELGDKICCSFGVDALEALAASCTALAGAAAGPPTRAAARAAARDAALAAALLLAHGGVVLCQALVFGVAMSSRKNTLLPLLIASNFAEIKSTVLKRFDSARLFALAKQDAVERFHLLVVLAFVLAEEAGGGAGGGGAGGAGAAPGARRALRQCAYVLLAEAVIDVAKHAVLGKFNEVRPGVYREFTRDLCEAAVGAQSHSVHRAVGFEPFAPAALFLRAALTRAALARGGGGAGAAGGGWFGSLLRGGGRAARLAGLWAVLVAAKLLLGFGVRLAAAGYLRRYEARRARPRAGAGRAQAARFGAAAPAPPQKRD
jgi:hypothetical protein